MIDLHLRLWRASVPFLNCNPMEVGLVINGFVETHLPNHVSKVESHPPGISTFGPQKTHEKIEVLSLEKMGETTPRHEGKVGSPGREYFPPRKLTWLAEKSTMNESKSMYFLYVQNGGKFSRQENVSVFIFRGPKKNTFQDRGWRGNLPSTLVLIMASATWMSWDGS